KGLFHATIRDAWAPDGADGFVYSVDWDGKPIVRERVRWPIVELAKQVARLVCDDDTVFLGAGEVLRKALPFLGDYRDLCLII
ncbi:AGE family epimerase/isomerase, partial [Salmonella enterica subsp. enterica serovar Montevideo]|nr:AGE family epimerase/isomerase [Salmonella enterica subsp. enterica serovar Montevideo]